MHCPNNYYSNTRRPRYLPSYVAVEFSGATTSASLLLCIVPQSPDSIFQFCQATVKFVALSPHPIVVLFELFTFLLGYFHVPLDNGAYRLDVIICLRSVKPRVGRLVGYR